MTLNKIKEYIRSNKNITHKFVFHGSRNQDEEFIGTITSAYPSIFIIALENGQVRSYSYSDLLISNLEVLD